MSRLKKLNKLNKTKTLSVAMSVGLVAANLVNAVPVMAVAPVSAHAMSTKTTIDPAKAQSFDKKDPQEISATVTVSNEEYQLQAVKNGSKTLEEGQDYTFDGSVITISPDYLMNQKVGTVSLKLDFDKGTDPVMRISVKDSRATAKLSTKTVDAKHLKDITATLTLNGDTFAGIEGLQEDSDYTVKGSRVTISKDYLATLADGPNTLVFNFDESPAVELTFTVKNSEAASIKSVEDVNVTTTVGTAPELPATVTATMSDGTTKEVAVQWGTVDVSNPGTVTVAGDVAGTTIKAKATVTVNALVVVQSVAAVDGINVNNGTTAADVIKTLPATVNVTMSDNTTVAANVTWAAPDSYSATTAGAYTFTGTLSGVNNPDTKTASVVVTVLAADSTAPTITPSSTTVNVTAASQAFTFTVADNANGTGVDPDSITVKQGTTALTATAVTGQANTYQVSLNEVKGANQTLTIDAKDKSGNAAATASVALVDKTLPTIKSVQALNSKQILVTYSEPVATTQALTEANYTLYNKQSGQTDVFAAAGAGAGIEVIPAFADSNHTQVKIQITNTNAVNGYPMGGISDGAYILYVSNVRDTAPTYNTIVPSSNAQFNGTLTPDTSVPTVVSASFNSGTGAVTLNFDKKVDEAVPADNKVSFKVGTQTVGLISTDYNAGTLVTADTTTVTFNLTVAGLAKVNALGANPTIVLTEGSFADSGVSCSAGEVVPTYTTAPALVAVTYDENTNTAVFKFSKTINVAAITSFVNMYSIAGRDIDATNAATFNNTTNSTDLSFTLSDADAQAIEALVRADGDGKVTATVDPGSVQDTDATPNTNQTISSSVDLVVGTGYTKDVTPPSLTGAKFNADTKVLEMDFNEAVRNNINDFTKASVQFYKDDNGVAGLQTTSVNGVAADTEIADFADVDALSASDNHAIDGTPGYLVTDTTAATPAVANSEKKSIFFIDKDLTATNNLDNSLAAVPASTDIYLNILAGGVKDTSANVTTAVQSVKVTKVAVSNTAAVSTANSTVTPSTVNSFVIAFKDAGNSAVAMDPTTVTNKANYNLRLTANPLNKPTIDKIIMGTNNTSATVILSTSMVAGAGYTLTTTGLKSASNQTGDLTDKAVIAAAANNVALASNGCVTTDVNGDGILDAGDKVQITFNEEIALVTGKTIADFAVDNSHSLGNSTFVIDDNYKGITFTLGSSSSVAITDTITFTGDVKDLEGNVIGADSEPVTAPSGTAAPSIISAVYNDVTADGSVGIGDTLVLTFDRDLKDVTGHPISDLTAADFLVTTNASLGTFTAAKTSARQVTLTFTAAPDFNATAGAQAFAKLGAHAVQIDYANNAAVPEISDAWGNSVAIVARSITAADVDITASDTTAPKLVGMKYNTTTRALTYVFEEAVNIDLKVSANSMAQLLANLVANVSNGGSVGTVGNATAATLSTDKKEVTIILDTDAALDAATKITVKPGDFVNSTTEAVQDASGNKAVRDTSISEYTLTISQ